MEAVFRILTNPFFELSLLLLWSHCMLKELMQHIINQVY